MSASPEEPKSTALSLDNPGQARAVILGGILLLCSIAIGYHNSLKVPFLFDDTESIAYNQSIRSFSTALTPPTQSGITVGGRPVLNLSFAINHALGGTEPFGYHLGNLLIHSLAALFLWGILHRTFRLAKPTETMAGDALRLGWFAAALWAIHPLQTESVTYTVQRAESLVGMFYLAALYCFIRHATTHRKTWGAAAILASLLGMGAKEVMFSAPLIIFLYDRTFISGTFGKAWRSHRWVHIGLASTTLLLLALIAGAQARGGTIGGSQTVTWVGYVCTQAYALVHYVWLFIWPAGLTLDYGPLIIRDALIYIPCGLAVILTLVGTAWAIVRKPTLGFLGAWFFAILAPSSSFIPINTQTIAEHRTYLALAALSAAVVIGTQNLKKHRSSALLAILIVAALSLTVARNNLYRDAATIWGDTLKKRPDNYRAWASMGFEKLHTENRPAEAMPYLEKALSLNPNHPHSLNRLGHAMIKLGRIDDGTKRIEASLNIDPDSMALNAGAGAAYMEAGQHGKALPCLYKALKHDPTNIDINYNIAICLTKTGRYAEAEKHFQAILERAPDHTDALNQYGILLQSTGRIDEMISVSARAATLSPDSALAHNNLGIAHMLKTNMQEGLAHLREAVRLAPSSPEFRLNLSHALALTPCFTEAIPLCESLLKEKPDAELYNNLGELYGRNGELEKARDAFQAALQLQPDNPIAKRNYEKAQAYLSRQATR